MAAKMTDLELMIQAGIDPKTGLPLKVECGSPLKASIKSDLQKIDRQDAVNRFRWYNLPNGLTGQLIEKILYYRGQGAFFYMDANDTFYFLPYALDGSIDVYGRFNSITPIPFAGGNTDGEGKDTPWIQGLSKKVAHDVILPEELTLADFLDSAVILHDISTGISQTNIPRSISSDGLLDVMADCIPFLRTALLSSTGISGMKVGNQSEYSNVAAAARSINKAALNGEPWVPIVGSVDFQNLTNGNVATADDFLLSLQSLDNFRLSTLGLDNGGIFQKRSHMLEAEQEMNTNNLGLVMQDSLTTRQNFCNIVNSIWGLGVWCEPSETSTGFDRNGNGYIEDSQEVETKEVEVNDYTDTDE